MVTKDIEEDAVGKFKELLDEVDTTKLDAGTPSPPRKSGGKVTDELDSLPKWKDNSVVRDENVSRNVKR